MADLKTSELLTLMDREANLLEADNWHQGAILMRLAADLIREQRVALSKPRIVDCDTGETIYP